MRISSNSGMGGFLAPPGHPTLFHHIEDGPSSSPNLLAGLDYALRNEYGDVSDRLQARVRKLYDAATPVRSDVWERHVYGYFRNCYAPEDGDRNVGKCIIPKAGEPVPPIERHLAYLLVKEYFPDAEPRPELLDPRNTLYGQRPCIKCGTGLQYEPKVDGFAEPMSARLDCPKGGQHQAEIPPIVVSTVENGDSNE